MVRFEVYDETVTCIRRENMPYATAEDTLIVIESIGVEKVVVFNRWTENDVKIRTSGKCNYNFKFTNKQMDKVMDLLVRLNGGNKLEQKHY